jgi:hypothetical protein
MAVLEWGLAILRIYNVEVEAVTTEGGSVVVGGSGGMSKGVGFEM